MHTLTHIVSDLVAIAKVLAGVAFFLGLVGSLVLALVHQRMPRVAAVARILAASGPDVQLFFDRCRQARDALRGSVVDSETEVRSTQRVVSGLLDAANRQSAALLELYRQDSYEALFRAALTGYKDADHEATTAALHGVDARWEPVWTAWRAVRAAALGATSRGHQTADEHALAVALRVVNGALAPAALRSFRALLSRSGELGARVVRLRDVDAELAIIASARELARVGRVQSEPPPPAS